MQTNHETKISLLLETHSLISFNTWPTRDAELLQLFPPKWSSVSKQARAVMPRQMVAPRKRGKDSVASCVVSAARDNRNCVAKFSTSKRGRDRIIHRPGVCGVRRSWGQFSVKSVCRAQQNLSDCTLFAESNALSVSPVAVDAKAVRGRRMPGCDGPRCELRYAYLSAVPLKCNLGDHYSRMQTHAQTRSDDVDGNFGFASGRTPDRIGSRRWTINKLPITEKTG